MFALEVLPSEEEVIQEVFDTGEEKMIENEPMCPYISLNALTGITAYQIIRVKGIVGSHTIHILVDFGSTHKFLDMQTAKKLGCYLVSTCPLQVAVLGEHNLVSNCMCKQLQWTLHGHSYSADVMTLPLGGCEMVLGIQWLSTLDNIQ